MSDSEEVITKPKALKPRSEAQKAATERMLNARKEKLAEKKSVIPEGQTLSKLEQKKLYLQAVKEKLNKGGKSKPLPEPEPESEAESDGSEFEFSEPEPEPEPKPKKKAPKPAPKPVVSRAKSVKNKTPAVHIPSESDDTESEAEEVIVVKKASKKKKAPKKKTVIIEPSSDEGETDSETDEAPYVPPPRPTKTQKHKTSTHRGPPAPSVVKPTYECYFA